MIDAAINLALAIAAFYALSRLSGTWNDDDNIGGYRP